MGRAFIQFIGAVVRFIVSYPIRKILGMQTFDFYTYLYGPKDPVNWEDSVNYGAANAMTFIALIVILGYWGACG